MPLDFQKPLTVVVPIFNAPDALEGLLDSLHETYPVIPAQLRFHFIDDASTDARIQPLLQSHPFLKSSQVVLSRNAQNLGFVLTVNSGMASADAESDVVLLNSDTLIYGDVFSRLQQEALQNPAIASLTPLTNNCTIASLVNWPQGTDDIFRLHPREIAKVVEAAELKTPLYQAPTGVGFCMYLTRRALDALGLFDAVTFGRGYGEENDWCQRAAKLGFLNLISPRAFVYHQGSQSFGGSKDALIRENLARLANLHPNYHADVQRYLDDNPLRGVRSEIAWKLSRVAKRTFNRRTIALVLHKDPENYSGGTEGHVRTVAKLFCEKENAEVFILFRNIHKNWVFRILVPDQSSTYFDFEYPTGSFRALLSAIESEIDIFHVHHIYGMSEHELAVLGEVRARRKVFTAHDYYTACPSINLIGKKDVYCGLPNDSSCDRCLSDLWNYPRTIGEYRHRMERFLSSFDQILVPSASAGEVLLRAFDARRTASNAEFLRERLRVVENPLPFAGTADQIPSPAKPENPKRFVFLGAFAPSKGSDLLPGAAVRLLNRGYAVELWGLSSVGLDPRVVMRPFRSWQELRRLGEIYPPFAVCMPSVWPETFSFTCYESLVVLGVPPIVGPFGNPAALVQKHGFGVVLRELTEEAIEQAAAEVTRRHSDLTAALRTHAPTVAANLTLEKLVDHLRPVYAWNTDATPPATLGDFSSELGLVPASRWEGEVRHLVAEVAHLDSRLNAMQNSRVWLLLRRIKKVVLYFPRLLKRTVATTKAAMKRRTPELPASGSGPRAAAPMPGA